jgi:lactoylglutathione lyase
MIAGAGTISDSRSGDARCKMRCMNRTIRAFLLSPILFLAVALVFSRAGTQSGRPEFDHTTLHVRDLRQSAEFYEKVIGLESIPHPFKDDLHRWFRAGAHQQLHLVGGAEKAPHDIEDHFAFRVTSVEEFMARLEREHLKYQSFDGKAKATVRPDGVKQIYFQDPNGYWIEVNDDRF